MEPHEHKIKPFTYNPTILSLLRECVFGLFKYYHLDHKKILITYGRLDNEREMNRLISFILLYYFPLEKNMIISPYRTGDYNDKLVSYIVEEYLSEGLPDPIEKKE